MNPRCPAATGPLSSTVLDLLACRPPQRSFSPVAVPVGDADPYGLDLHLALYVCYELHYRGFAGVDPRWEWNPVLLPLRGQLEDAFLDAVRSDVGDVGADDTADAEMDALCVEPVDGNGSVLLPARRGHLGADAGVLRAPLALPPQGGRSARVGHPRG